MQTSKRKWDVARAAAWLRRRTWGARGEAGAPAPDEAVVAAAQAEADAAAATEDDEIDVAGWPALVAPFYD